MNNNKLESPLLIGIPDAELLMLSGSATHQHFKGGLYQLVGSALDADTGEELVTSDGEVIVFYYHLFPYDKRLCARRHSEFFGTVNRDGEEKLRFRPLRGIRHEDIHPKS